MGAWMMMCRSETRCSGQPGVRPLPRRRHAVTATPGNSCTSTWMGALFCRGSSIIQGRCASSASVGHLGGELGRTSGAVAAAFLAARAIARQRCRLGIRQPADRHLEFLAPSQELLRAAGVRIVRGDTSQRLAVVCAAARWVGRPTPANCLGSTSWWQEERQRTANAKQRVRDRRACERSCPHIGDCDARSFCGCESPALTVMQCWHIPKRGSGLLGRQPDGWSGSRKQEFLAWES